MDQLFAPWRIEWVRRPKPIDEGECVFCRMVDADDDREQLVVARTDRAFVVLNNYPYNPGHLLVVPHRHTGAFQALDSADLTAFARLTQTAIEAIERSLDPDGFNVGCNLGAAAAGGSIGDHVHRHIVPRWNGDTNFMPVIGDTKVIVEALEDTYDSLHEAFGAFDAAETAGDGAVVLRQD